MSEGSLAPDNLTKLPNPGYSYIDSNGKLKNPDKYYIEREEEEPHPKLAELREKGKDTPANELYYKGMPHDRRMPIAGVIPTKPDPRDSEVRGAASQSSTSESSFQDSEPFEGDEPSKPSKKNKKGKKSRKKKTNNEFQEESFNSRPSIKLPVPDHIKAILVDDWENVTKNLQLVPLPAAMPVNVILNDYLQFEKPRRQAGSAQADILDEVIAGMKEYFDKCLARILLYRQEPQLNFNDLIC